MKEGKGELKSRRVKKKDADRNEDRESDKSEKGEKRIGKTTAWLEIRV